MPVEFSGNEYSETIRTSACELLMKSVKCPACTKYRSTLRSMYHRWNARVSTPGSTSMYANECYHYEKLN